MALADLTRENIDPQEGFVLSRVNGQWDVRSILKLCPMSEERRAAHLRPPACRAAIIDFVEVGDRR